MTSPTTGTGLVEPAVDDPFVAHGSGLIGGPLGRWARRGGSWWTPVRVLLPLTVVVLMLGWWQKEPCLGHAWAHEYQYTRGCYSDVYALFFSEHLNEGAVPYMDHAVEYPVLTGGVMWVASSIARAVSGADYAPLWFFTVTAAILGACALVTVVATVRLSGRRQWDAALVAMAPVLLLHAFTNWDLLAAAFLATAMVAWARRHPVAAGVLVGLGTAAKLYPALLLVALLPLCLRARRMRAWGAASAAAAVTWLVVNAPVFLLWRDSWWTFFKLNKERPADWDSLWFQLGRYTEGATGGLGKVVHDVVAPVVPPGQSPASLNWLTIACVVAMTGLVLALAWWAPRRPRVPQVAFLVVLAFLLGNKVWSPQYVIWYLPLAVLALPRWRPLLLWQASEAVLLITRFYYFVHSDTGNKGIYIGWYFAAVLVRDLVLIGLAALVVRDILRPEHDVVRRSGMDDPAGGVLTDEPDPAPVRRSRRRRPAYA
ncbi:MAG: glycosyltransferase family 87 protein [Frankiaceae bacterium]